MPDVLRLLRRLIVAPNAEALLVDRLADARSREVVLLSHCLLNENTRYLGGAFHPGAVPEAVELVRSGAGIHQLPCPEQRVWGGVHKRHVLRAYGLRRPLYRLRGLLLRVFVAYTRGRYRRLARRVVADIADYRRAGVRVRAVVGVGGSPSCGVTTGLDLRRSLDVVAGCPLTAIDRATINERAVAGCAVAGEGLFVTALRRELARRRIEVEFCEHDLLAEMHGLPSEALAALARRRGAEDHARRVPHSS